MNLILYLCAGTPSVPVTGKTGESVTLTCESEDREITRIVLTRLSENILVCESEECKSENDRVFKEGSCDVFIKDLRLSDAGKYILRVYYTNDQTELERLTLEYHLHLHDEISVHKGEDLKLGVLLIHADKVEHQNTISSEWTEVWTRGHRVNSDRINDSDGNLTINEFTVTDTGTYRVLDYNNKTLITVSVSESDRLKPAQKHTQQYTYHPKPATLRSTPPSTDEVTVTERVLMFGGVGLAVFVFFLTTVIAGGIIYHRGQQKGWKAAKQEALIS
ncbi:unnamed protein product [Leuciscus chuanchicus]